MCLFFYEAVGMRVGKAESVWSEGNLVWVLLLPSVNHGLQIILEVRCCHLELRGGAGVLEGCSVFLISPSASSHPCVPVARLGSSSKLSPLSQQLYALPCHKLGAQRFFPVLAQLPSYTGFAPGLKGGNFSPQHSFPLFSVAAKPTLSL